MRVRRRLRHERVKILRHEGLHRLSGHHHHALVIAHRLMKAGGGDSQWTPLELQQKLRDFWDNGGNEHFREEEEILLPTYVRYADIERPEVVEMLLDHVELRSMVQLILAAETPRVEDLRTLGELLEDHVRKEERVIFPLIEKAIPEDVLRELGDEFTDLTPER
ncbi:hemerythrin domain-containing protein [Numidum massiliense]|uniref:hemerythrin domain-containing protein n=1 Tax=Numidum massiliense TaxID=1522315 RepID=UPI001E3B2299|nr:hemerythrin domain-containing protein [Numidum massiliense]